MKPSSRTATPLAGSVALVTGAGRGIGAAVARRLHEEGAVVVLADLRRDEPAAVAEGLARAVPLALDVSSPDGWRQVMAEVEAEFGRLDVLVNNAGILRTGSIEEMALEDYLAVVQTNQVGPWLGTQAAAPLMRRSGGGSIVNVSSIGALGGIPGSSAYCATKAAVRSLTKVAAIELADSGIRVNSVLPGAIDTQMSTRAQSARTAAVNPFIGQPIPRAGTVEEVAAMVAFLVTGASYCTGADFVVDGGTTAVVGPAAGPDPRAGDARP